MTATRLVSPLLPVLVLAPVLALALACRSAPADSTPPEGAATASPGEVDAPSVADPVGPEADAQASKPEPEGDAGASAGDDGAAEATTIAGAEEPAETPPVDAAKATPEPTKAAAAALPAPIFGKAQAGCGRDPGVGEAAKPFNLKTPAGKDISLQSLRGKVVLLNFWGTWCKPCLKELPEFERLYRRYKKNGLVLVAVATDSDPAPVEAFTRERKLSAKMAIGGEEVANAYKSPNFPFSFVVDPKGTIRASYRGFKPECLGQLEQDLREELAKLGR